MTDKRLTTVHSLGQWPAHEYASAFAGPWIGETTGCASLAHIWEIEVRSVWMTIHSRWEGESGQTSMSGRLIEGEPAFIIGEHKGVLLGAQHFVIPKWDTNDVRGGKGRAYDVIFSRPGIAELSAHEAYRRFKRAKQGKSKRSR